MGSISFRTKTPLLRIKPLDVQNRVRQQPRPMPFNRPVMRQDRVQIGPQSNGFVPATQVSLDLSNLVQYSAPSDNTRVTYTDKLAKSMQDFSKANIGQTNAYGSFVKGAAKSTVYAPAGALEAAGRTVIAMTGGEVAYRGASPLNHVGSGFSEMGRAAHQIAVTTDEQLAAIGRSVIYAPLAGAEAVAHGAGLAAGTTVRVVSESFLGKEFAEGYAKARH